MSGCSIGLSERMGQVLIRNLDDDIIAGYREAAARNRRSLEAGLRDTPRRLQPICSPQKKGVRRRFAELRARTPSVPQTPAEAVLRQLRGE